MGELKELREQINRIDKKIFNLIKMRMEIVGRLGVLKKKERIQVVDKIREEEVMKALELLAARSKVDVGMIRKIWGELFKEAYKLEGS